MFEVHAVVSNQTGLHPRLDEVVRRHLAHPYRRPAGEPTRFAVSQLQMPENRAWILDAGCGTAESSFNLAIDHPQSWVLGLDKSANRLSQATSNLPVNLSLLRADLTDFALLAEQSGWRFETLYLFYPNPWPKAEHLQRRWHGHAVFPSLLKLANRIELRSNWALYVQEFARALELAGWTAQSEIWMPQNVISAFERKYTRAGQTLYRLTACLS